MDKVRRGLNETAVLLEKIGQRFEEAGEQEYADDFLQKACDNKNKSEIIRDLVMQQERLSEDMRFEKHGELVHK